MPRRRDKGIRIQTHIHKHINDLAFSLTLKILELNFSFIFVKTSILEVLYHRSVTGTVEKDFSTESKDTAKELVVIITSCRY